MKARLVALSIALIPAPAVGSSCPDQYGRIGTPARAAVVSAEALEGRLSGPIGRFRGSVQPTDFVISEAQKAQARSQIDHRLLSETLFVVPNNDGEARRAVEILQAAGAPHLQVSAQAWGATLEREPLRPDVLARVRRVVIFEIPGQKVEDSLRAQGLEVLVIDHHAYQGLDRRRPEGSLEQLMGLIRWPMSAADEAIAVNDRGYIPGLKKLGLSADEIRAIRTQDLVAQGRSLTEIEGATGQAQGLIPSLPRLKNGTFVLDRVTADETILKQELAIQEPNGLVSTFEIRPDKLGFSGNPAAVQKLLELDYETLGYAPGAFAKYGGGDPKASMFFGFKPKSPPQGETALIPERVLQQIRRVIEGEGVMSNQGKPRAISASDRGTVVVPEVRDALMMPRGSALATSSGRLSEQGITQIIHAATGSMSRGGKEFDPTLKGVVDAVQNSLELARLNGHRRVAVPFLGGKIFVDRIGIAPQELANAIVKKAIDARGDAEIRFVTFGDFDTGLFQNAVREFGASLPSGAVQVTPGSITDFRVSRAARGA